MRYKVNLSYPTIIEIQGKDYILFPDAEIELPDADIVETYKGLGYLKPVENTKTKIKQEEE